MAVRNEKVVLSLEDHFTTPMAKAAAATALTNRELKSLSGTSVETSRDSDRLTRSVGSVGDEIEQTGVKARRSAADIDRYSGRLRLITEAVTVLGPGLVPLGAATLPVVSALAAGLGAVAGAAGTVLLAFNGMGDALEAIDEYQLSPTTENLHAMQDALSELGPAGADFAQFLNSLGPTIDELQNVAREGLFPGLQEGIEELMPLLPQVEQIVSNIATSLGRLGDDAGAALAGGRFAEFFDYLERDAAPTMEAFARSTGNLAEGLANLLVAFGPLTSDFTGGLERMTRSFADWSASLSKTDGFRDFVEYIRSSGPQAVSFLGAMGTAFAAVLKAAAPLGQVVLPALTAFARVITLIADSPIGQPLFTAAAALIAVNRAVTLGTAGFGKYVGGLDATTGGMTRMQKAAGALGVALAGLAIVDTLQSTDKAVPGVNEMTNSLLALGDVSNSLPKGLDDLAAGIERLANPNAGQKVQDTLSGMLGGNFNDSLHDNAVKQVEAIDQALTNIVNNQGAEVAARSLEALAKSAGLSESQLADLVSLMPGYRDAVAGAAGATNSYAASNDYAAKTARATSAQIRGLVDAMEEQRSSALAAFDAVTQYGAAVDAARKQAEKSNAGLSENTKEGRANREALSQLAAAWNNQSKSVTNNVGKWREARANFIQTATAMGVPIEKARDLARRMLEIPRQRVIDIKLYGSEQAANQLEQIRDAVVSIPREWSTTYYVNQVNSISRRYTPDKLPGESADGGTVPKTGMAYADRHHYLLADGEEVISNRYGQADRHRSLLKAINAGRLADGGTAGPLRPLDDRLAIAQAMQQIRDLTRDLNARVKKGKHKGDLVTTGIDRRVLELQLAAARRDLKSAETREQREKEAKQNERTMDRYRAALGKELDRETAARDRLSEAVDKNMGEVDRLTGLYDNLAGTIRSGLDANQFEPMAGNAWDVGKERMPSIDEIIGRLQGSTADAGAFMRGELAISQHLSGAALESVLSQGLDAVSMFAELSPEQLQAYQLAFDQNEVAKAWAGAVGGGTVYGRDLNRAEQIAEASQEELAKQTAVITALQAQQDAAAKENARILGVATTYLAAMVAEQQKLTGGAKSGQRSRR